MRSLQSTIFSSQSRAGGPQHIQRFDLLLDGDGFNDRLDGGFRGGGLTVKKEALPDPIKKVEELAGGLTLAQLDQAARMEVEEGAPILIGYGELLLAGTLVAHKYKSTAPKQNDFTVILGEGWGGLGRHGEWEGIVKAWYKGEELLQGWFTQIYVNDKLPAGATQGGNDGWNWITKNPTPYFGKYAHQSPNIAGFHEHFFLNATETMAVVTSDTLFAFIWIDPINTPQEIMLVWQDGSGSVEHRAYWGPNLIAAGVNGTPSRWQISASIPATGQWVRLDVPASAVGLEGQTVKGMGYALFDGRATWDKDGRWRFPFGGGTYLFRPGIISTDVQTIQHAGVFSLNTGLTYSGSANVVVRLTEAQSQEDRPDGFKCRVRCRRVFNFDATGAEIDYGYSKNPARVAADRVLHFFEQRFRNNLDLAREKFRARIHWPAWVEWRDYCDQFIPWDHDGDGTNIFVPRFEISVGFNADISLAQALDQITGASASMWQDDGSQLIFLPPSPRPPVHHFHPGNIVGGGVGISVVDLRRRANRFIARARSFDDPFLGAVAIEPPEFTPEWERRQRAIARVGEIRSERELPSMTESQLSRIITYRAHLEFHNPVTYSLVGMADAFKVLPGDFATISHPEIEREFQLCLVTGIRKRSIQSSADEIGFLLQRIDGPLYDDTAHRPRQEALTLP